MQYSIRRLHGAAALACALLFQVVVVTPAFAQPTSELKVFKYINGDFRPAGVVFSMTVDCADPPFTQTVSVASESFAELTTIPVPNVCTVTENLPLPAAPEGYQWDPTNTPPEPQVVVVPNAEEIVVSVFNALIPLAGTIGSLEVGKNVVGGAAPGAVFTVQIDCGKAFSRTVDIPAGGVVVIDDIPAPTSCTVTESPALPAPPAGFLWNPANTPPPPIAVEIAVGATSRVDVTNSLLGVPPPAPPVQPVPLGAPLMPVILGLMMLVIAGVRMRRMSMR